MIKKKRQLQKVSRSRRKYVKVGTVEIILASHVLSQYSMIDRHFRLYKDLSIKSNRAVGSQSIDKGLSSDDERL